MPAWSYSSIKTFEQCPKKYFHLKVAKDVVDESGPEAVYGTEVHLAAEEFIRDGKPIPEKYGFMQPIVERLAQFPGDKRAEMKVAKDVVDESGPEAVYGTEVHLAAEEFIRDGKPIPEKYGFMQPIVERLAKFPGDKRTEMKVGLRKTDYGYEPCSFFDKEVWYRGIIDLLIVDGDKAHLLDYKTGKSAKYADMKQLDLMAGAIFIHYPEVQKIKSGLLYVVSNEFPKKVHVREKLDQYLSVFNDQLDRLNDAMENGIFNPKSGPLCGWCPVVECAHWKPRRK